MKRFLSVLLCGIVATYWGYAYSPKDLRFYSDQDTIKINNLLSQAKDKKMKLVSETMLFFANSFIDTPYVAHTLESDDHKEYLTINVSQFDCSTFVETVLALSQCYFEDKTSWRDYAEMLEEIRYHNGQIDGYALRLHYFSSWIIENIARGNIQDKTLDISSVIYSVKTLDFMSKHTDLYAALSDPQILQKIQSTEIGYHSHRIPYIKKGDISNKDFLRVVKDGDIVAITTKVDGLDVSHVGIVKMVDGVPHLLHASSAGKKVLLSSEDLKEYVRRNQMSTGVRLLRLKRKY